MPAGQGRGEEQGYKNIGAYGRDIVNDNGNLLLSFANNYAIALVNTFFSTSKGGVQHTFDGLGKPRINYILTRQSDRKLVQNVTVHPQFSSHPIYDHNVVSAFVEIIGYFARNHRLKTTSRP